MKRTVPAGFSGYRNMTKFLCCMVKLPEKDILKLKIKRN
jgi:hypothetical protein